MSTPTSSATLSSTLATSIPISTPSNNPTTFTTAPSSVRFPSETENLPSGTGPPTTTCTADCRGDGADSASVSYQYVFIAAFFILVGVALWTIHQRRRKRLLAGIQGQRSALARDVHNDQLRHLYPNNRRWTGEGRRGHQTRQSAVVTTRDEGLDDQGEAPPPYKPAGQDDPSSAVDLAVPMQTLRRDGTAKPPEYHEYSATQGWSREEGHRDATGGHED